jgi:hypothetical protein
MHGALYLYPLGVFLAGFEHGKVDAFRVRGERSAAENADLRFADDGTEASWGAHTPHIHQGSYEERLGRFTRELAIHFDKDVSGIIVNEDSRLPRTEVRIKVGDDSTQMDRKTADSLFVGEIVRLARGGDRGRPGF